MLNPIPDAEAWLSIDPALCSRDRLLSLVLSFPPLYEALRHAFDEAEQAVVAAREASVGDNLPS